MSSYDDYDEEVARLKKRLATLRKGIKELIGALDPDVPGVGASVIITLRQLLEDASK